MIMDTVEERTCRPFDICDRTFEFALAVVRLRQRLDQVKSCVSWGLTKQLLRSGTSIGANVKEGQGAQSRADFISKYSIARKEARETRYWLRLVQASGVIPGEVIQPLLNEVTELLRIVTAIIKNATGK
jgi:four helix bundle protein